MADSGFSGPVPDPNTVVVSPPTTVTADWGEPRLRISGFGAPTAETGVDGDFYFDLTNFVNQQQVFPDVYGPKVDGAWGDVLALGQDYFIAQDGATPTEDDIDGPDIWLQIDQGGTLVHGPRQLTVTVDGFQPGDLIVRGDSAWVSESSDQFLSGLQTQVEDLEDTVAQVPAEFWRRSEGEIYYTEGSGTETFGDPPSSELGVDGDWYQKRVVNTGGGTSFNLWFKDGGVWDLAVTTLGGVSFRFLDGTDSEFSIGPVPVAPAASLLASSPNTGAVGFFDAPVFAEPEDANDMFTLVAFYVRDTEVKTDDILRYSEDYDAWVPESQTQFLSGVQAQIDLIQETLDSMGS